MTRLADFENKDLLLEQLLNITEKGLKFFSLLTQIRMK